MWSLAPSRTSCGPGVQRCLPKKPVPSLNPWGSSVDSESILKTASEQSRIEGSILGCAASMCLLDAEQTTEYLHCHVLRCGTTMLVALEDSSGVVRLLHPTRETTSWSLPSCLPNAIPGSGQSLLTHSTPGLTQPWKGATTETSEPSKGTMGPQESFPPKDVVPFSSIVCPCPSRKERDSGVACLTSLSSGCRSHTTPVSGSTAKKREASSPDTPNTKGSLSMSRASNWVTEEPGVVEHERKRKHGGGVTLISSFLAQIMGHLSGQSHLINFKVFQRPRIIPKPPKHHWAV